jgi:hypothetical protein
MIEILRTNDPVLLSFVSALFKDAGIEMVILDTHASVMDGSVSAIQRRVVVADEDEGPAKRLLETAQADIGSAGVEDTND